MKLIKQTIFPTINQLSWKIQFADATVLIAYLIFGGGS